MFGVNDAMRRWGAAPNDDGTRTIVLAAFLTPLNGAATQQISTSFVKIGSGASDLISQAAAFVDRSSAAFATGRCELHIVHDKDDLTMAQTTNMPCVHFHRFNTSVEDVRLRHRAAATDRRWPMYLHVLDELALARDDRESAWDCAWAVDLTDVIMLRLPPCAALPDNRLSIARDGLYDAQEVIAFLWRVPHPVI